MARRSSWLKFLVLLVLVGTTHPLAAADRRKAKEHFLAAEAHYKLGRFQKALQEYSRAYEFAPLPAFLFNMGQCHRQLGHHERALFFYAGYLREEPNAPNREAVQQLIEHSRQELRRQRAEEKRRVEEKRRAEQERQRAEAEQEKERLRLEREQRLALERARLEARANRAPAPPAFYEKWWFWTIVGGALAVIAGGSALALGAEDRLVLPRGSLGTLDLRDTGR